MASTRSWWTTMDRDWVGLDGLRCRNCRPRAPVPPSSWNGCKGSAESLSLILLPGPARVLRLLSPGKPCQPMKHSSNHIRILIADDHAIFRDGLKKLLACCEDFDVVGEAADGGRAIKLARELKPD